MKMLSLLAVMAGLCASAFAGGQQGGGFSGGSMGGSGGGGSFSGNSNSSGAQGNMRGTFPNKKKIGKTGATGGGSGAGSGTHTFQATPAVAGAPLVTTPANAQGAAPAAKTPVTVFGNNGFGLGNGSNSFGNFSGGTPKP